MMLRWSKAIRMEKDKWRERLEARVERLEETAKHQHAGGITTIRVTPSAKKGKEIFDKFCRVRMDAVIGGKVLAGWYGDGDPERMINAIDLAIDEARAECVAAIHKEYWAADTGKGTDSVLFRLLCELGEGL